MLQMQRQSNSLIPHTHTHKCIYICIFLCICIYIYIWQKSFVPLYFILMSHHAEGSVRPPFLCDLLQEHTVSYQPNTPSKLDMICCISIGEAAVKNQHPGLELSRSILYKSLPELADSSKWSFLQKRASSSGIFLWHNMSASFRLKCFI